MKKVLLRIKLILLVTISLIFSYSLKAESLEIISFGDSITAGMIRINGDISCPSGVSNTRSVFTSADRRLLCNGYGAEGVGGYQPSLKSKLQSDGYSVLIYNHGYSGAESGQLTGMLNTFLNQKPNSDYILIMSGANDSGDVSTSTFIFNTEFMIKASCNKGIVPIVATATRRFDSSSRNNWILSYNEGINDIKNPSECSSKGIKFRIADQYEATNASKNFTDGIHLSSTGNLNMANEWYRALTTSPSNNSFLPSVFLLLNE